MLKVPFVRGVFSFISSLVTGISCLMYSAKFYDDEEERNFNWSRWFFPVLTTDRGLRELDRYFAECLRYIKSGRHYKGNYSVTYEKLKSLGYRSLVNEYYKFKKHD